MPGYTTRTTCRVCGSSDLTPLFSFGDQYVSDFVPVGIHEKIEAYGPGIRLKVPIDIEMCRTCTLVQAKHTAPQDFLYSRHYWYRSGVTQTMRDALRDVARSAAERADLKPGDVVLDIGSNDGSLLRCYEKLNVVTVGVEPATNLAEEGRRGVDVFINDFWKGQDPGQYIMSASTRTDTIPYSPVKAKIITAIGMFYDLEDPNQFIANVAKVLHPDGVFAAQLMCLKQTVEKGDVGNFAHEHLEFYSLKSLATLFEKHGLRIHGVEENDVNGGSYRVFAKHSTHHPEQPRTSTGIVEFRPYFTKEWEMGLDKPGTYAAFVSSLEANRDRVYGFISDRAAEGKKVWVYGASTKGNVILQYYGLDNRLIKYAVDKSPEKWGKYTVGTGIEIVPPLAFHETPPDYALILPYAFTEEFVRREDEWLRAGGKFIVPLPVPAVIGVGPDGSLYKEDIK